MCVVDWQDDADRKEETLAIIADLLGFSWTGTFLSNRLRGGSFFTFVKRSIELLIWTLYWAMYFIIELNQSANE